MTRYEEVKSPKQDDSPVPPHPKRRKRAASSQFDSAFSDSPGPSQGSAWRMIRNPHEESVTDLSRKHDIEADSPTKKVSFRIRNGGI